MMIFPGTNIAIGGMEVCDELRQFDYSVHACKNPCYMRKCGVKSKDDLNYLHFIDGKNLYLNIIDPPVPLFMIQTFKIFLSFAAMSLADGQSHLRIHCNLGLSRAPSLALLYLAKRAGMISNKSYDDARYDFESVYTDYKPGLGIQTFLRDNWQELR
jgi:hypothetical protein